MAVQFKAEHRRGSVYLFFPQDIVIRPELNGRHDLPDIAALKADIEKNGQLVPVLVRNDGGRPVLAAGFSRWRAVTELNKDRKPADHIRLICSYIGMDEREAYLANYKENRLRNQTTPLDDAHQFSQMERWGWSVKEIAEKCGVKESVVRRGLKLATTTPELKQALQSGRLKASAALSIAKLSAEQQKALVAGNGTVSADKLAAATGRKPTAKQRIDTLRPAIEEAADMHPVKAVQEFARRLLGLMDA